MTSLVKALPITLRSVGLDEKWVQDQVQKDPSLLGLGDLEIAGREHRQPVGGRIDFLMRNLEADTYYEVEIMLGALDESHIIRTIEYWDIERQRRPQSDHRAVIVAEQITGRFFNILRLLNRAVPLIAIKLSAFEISKGSIVLHPVKVLDIVDEVFDDRSVDQTEQADRPFWEKRSPTMLKVLEKFESILTDNGAPLKITYNKHHIAVGGTGRNFCWLNPRRAQGRCHVEFRYGNDTRDVVLAELQASNIDASARETQYLGFGITLGDLEATQGKSIAGALKAALQANP